MCTVHGCVRSVVVSVYKMSVHLSLTIWIHWLLWPPFSFHILFIFIYSSHVKKQHHHFIFFGPFCTYLLSHVLALPQVLPFFYFYNSCGHIHSFIILYFLTHLDSLWLTFLLYLYSADCAFSSFTFQSFLHRCVLSFSFHYFSWLRHVLLSSYSSYY